MLNSQSSPNYISKWLSLGINSEHLPKKQQYSPSAQYISSLGHLISIIVLNLLKSSVGTVIIEVPLSTMQLVAELNIEAPSNNRSQISICHQFLLSRGYQWMPKPSDSEPFLMYLESQPPKLIRDVWSVRPKKIESICFSITLLV